MTTRHEQRPPRTGRSLRVADATGNDSGAGAPAPTAQLTAADFDRTRAHLAGALRPMDPRQLRSLEQAHARHQRTGEQRSPVVQQLMQLGLANTRAERLRRDVRGAMAYARRLLRSPHRQVRDLGRELLDHARQLAATVARHILRPLRRALAPREPIDSPTRAYRALAPPPPTDPLIRARQLVAAPGAPGTGRGRFARAA